MKVLQLTTSILLAFALMACDNNNNTSNSTTNASGQVLKIGVWGGNEAEEKSLDVLIKNFEQATGSRVEKKVYTDYNTQIQADLIGRTAPDVFYVDSSMFPFFASQGVLSSLENVVSKDDYYDNLTKAFEQDGKLYAAPKDFSTLALYINTDMLSKAGLSVNDVPASYEQLLEFLPVFQEKLDEAYGKNRVFAMTYTPELSRSYHLAKRNGGVPITDAGLANLGDEIVSDNLSILQKLVATNAVITPQEGGFGWNGEIFGSAKVALIDEGNWVYQTLKMEYPDTKFTVKQMPAYKNEDGTMMFVVGWGKYIESKNSQLADKWIQYVAGKDGMSIWVEQTGTLPSRADVADSTVISKNKDLQEHLAGVKYGTPWQKGVTLNTINKAYINFIAKAVRDDDFRSVMQEVDSSANAEIK